MKKHFLPLAVAVGLFGLASAPARAELIYGLTTGNAIISFDSLTPTATTAPVTITGVGGETIYDIDVRPANGLLYGLSSAGTLYSINPLTGVATSAGALTGVSLDPAATRFGIDFNPTVDRLRIVSNTGQNLRLTPVSGVTTVDGALNGAATSAVSVAYTNNFAGATTTTLFYIGPNTPNTLYNTSNPNGGVMTTVGALGQTSTQNVGFDISGSSGTAYATLTGANSLLYTVNLTTGAATFVGNVDTALTLRGIAVVPEPSTWAMLIAGGAALAAGVRRRARRA